MAVDVGTITAKLTLEDQMSATLKKVQGDLGEMVGIAEKVAAVFATAFSVAGLVDIVKSTIAFASKLEDLSASTGISAESLQKLGFAAKRTGVDMEQIGVAVAQFSRRLADAAPKTTGFIQGLGLNIKNLLALNPHEAFLDIADAIAKIQNPMQRAEVAMGLFGRTGAQMLPLMTQGLREVEQQAAKTGAVMSESTAKQLDALGDKAGDLLGKFKVLAAEGIVALMKGFGDLGQIFTGTKVSVDLAGGSIRQLGRDIELVPEKTKGMLTSTQILKNRLDALRKDALEPLSRQQRQQIADLKAWGLGEDEIAKLVQSNVVAVHKYIDVLAEQEAARKKAAEEQKRFADAMRELDSASENYLVTLDQISGQTVEAVRFYLQAGVAQEKLALAYALTDVQIKAIVESLRVLDAASAISMEAQASDQDQWLQRTRAAVDERDRIFVDHVTATKQLWADYYTEVDRQTMASTSAQIAEIQRWMAAEIAALQNSDVLGAYQEHYDAIVQLAQARIRGIFDAETAAHTRTMAEANAKEAAAGWMAGFGKIMDGVPALIVAALTGGGGASGSVLAAASQLGSLAGKQLGQMLGDTLDKVLGGSIAPMLTGLLPGIGSMLGGLVGLIGPIASGIKSLFGGPSKEELAGRDVVGAFEEEIQSRSSASAALVAGGRSWEATTIAVRDAYLATGRSATEAEAAVRQLWASSTQGADAARAAAANINAVFDEQARDVVDLQDAIARYGFTIEELGPALQKQELDKQAKQIMNDFRLLVGAGVDMNAVIDRMGPAMNEFAAMAMRTGQEVPNELRPILQKMIDLGELTDAAGNKITSLDDAGFTFAETMTQGFDRVVDKLAELIDGLVATGVAIDQIPRRIDIDVNYSDPGPGGGAGDTRGDEMQHGGMGRVSRPTLFLAGEAGPEEFAFSGANKRFGRPGGGRGGGDDALLLAIERLHDELRQLPRAIQRGVRDGVALAGV